MMSCSQMKHTVSTSTLHIYIYKIVATFIRHVIRGSFTINRDREKDFGVFDITLISPKLKRFRI